MPKSEDFLVKPSKVERQVTMIYSSKHDGITVPIYNMPGGEKLYKEWVRQIDANQPLDGVVECGMVSPPKASLIGKFFDVSDES